MATKKRKSSKPPIMVNEFTVDSKGRFNGKPMAHWEALSDELMIRCLLDAANLDTRSIVGAKTAERIINLAMAIDPVTVRKLIAERETIEANVARTLNHMMGR